jgi:hypothetical protein
VHPFNKDNVSWGSFRCTGKRPNTDAKKQFFLIIQIFLHISVNYIDELSEVYYCGLFLHNVNLWDINEGIILHLNEACHPRHTIGYSSRYVQENV